MTSQGTDVFGNGPTIDYPNITFAMALHDSRIHQLQTAVIYPNTELALMVTFYKTSDNDRCRATWHVFVTTLLLVAAVLKPYHTRSGQYVTINVTIHLECQIDIYIFLTILLMAIDVLKR